MKPIIFCKSPKEIENIAVSVNIVLAKEFKKQMIEVLKGRCRQDMTIKDTIDLVVANFFDSYFNEKYKKYSVMKTKITLKNMADNAHQTFDHFAGKNLALYGNVTEPWGS